MPQVSVQLVGRIRRKITVPDSCSVADLRRLIAAEFQISCDRLRLVTGGATLADCDTQPALADGDSILAFATPRLPSKYSNGVVRGTGDYLDAEAEDERFRLRVGATRAERLLAGFLQQQMRLPDVVLQQLFRIPLSVIIAFVLWMMLLPLAAWFYLAPPFILLTMIVVIFTNLGTRQPGEQSAYSVFNEGIRALPGQLDADAIDDQMRRGQM